MTSQEWPGTPVKHGSDEDVETFQKSHFASLRDFVPTVELLSQAYGWRILGLIVFGQWIVKGLVWGYCDVAMDFLFREYAVPGPRMQICRAIATLPWAIKPLFGLVSDVAPLFGYKRGPHMLLATVSGVTAYIVLSFAALRGLPVKGAVLCLFAGCLQVSVVDLLTEARYAEKVRDGPEYGPDLITFVWMGITLGNLIANATVGFILEHYGPTTVYACTVIPAALVLLPICLNWGEEKPCVQSFEQVKQRLRKDKELVFLVVLMGASTLLLLFVGLMEQSSWVNLGVGLVIGVLVIGSFLVLLRPVIGLVVCFSFIQAVCALDVRGATFYFFTDDEVEFPEGPHFSKLFFASGLGVCVSLLNLVGMVTYGRYMKTWRYHAMFIFANCVLCSLNLLCVFIYTRSNVAWGIPDHIFVLSGWAATSMAFMWIIMPGVVLISHLCPEGIEATMYAMLAGSHNLGATISAFGGACLLEALNIRPNGSPNEGHQFDNLWIASLVSASLPTAAVILLPWMIPNERQTERLLPPGADAVGGSLWRRWNGLDDGAAEGALAVNHAANVHYGSTETRGHDNL
eukprot:CAMPEP_0206438504 /NCGR_PEP_ID=MMETSP0324_2-20121206/11670_1 /ASSEMBLY_ACC=CAM_ASM_000836 /TAXON_ID=2866 /ORGANISM="Crypthecodinium cohnii, Strain Seligo" /LENGTH=571 /DNA_ID=CAMNT_0053905977 /DNA_START=120 /DNA_END=1835 /DNA_ORIENTATION=+